MDLPAAKMLKVMIAYGTSSLHMRFLRNMLKLYTSVIFIQAKVQ